RNGAGTFPRTLSNTMKVRRIRRDPRYQIVYLAMVVALLLLGWWLEPHLPTQPTPTRNAGALENGSYGVLRVVDGDTLLLRKSRLRVRLQGVDTPETVKENSP